MPNDFSSVAVKLCDGVPPASWLEPPKGDPEEWFAKQLGEYVWAITGPKRSPTKPDKQEHEALIACVRLLLTWWLPVQLAAAELANDQDAAECFDDALTALEPVLERLEEDREPPTKPRDVRRRICAGVCAHIWRRRVGKVEPHSPALWEACEAYWRACGQPATPSDDSWEHYLSHP